MSEEKRYTNRFRVLKKEEAEEDDDEKEGEVDLLVQIKNIFFAPL